ncbi:MAG: hypothetical protein PHX51_08410 [Clostridia bacterium]|nr:hypothetical protein [Clostridia bacterium]
MKLINNTGRDQIFFSEGNSLVVKHGQVVEHAKHLHGLTKLEDFEANKKAEESKVYRPAEIESIPEMITDQKETLNADKSVVTSTVTTSRGLRNGIKTTDTK